MLWGLAIVLCCVGIGALEGLQIADLHEASDGTIWVGVVFLAPVVLAIVAGIFLFSIGGFLGRWLR
jgi:hypothetical protein